MRTRSTLIATAALLAIAGCGGCGQKPEPEALFAHAEVLRLAYEQSASRAAVDTYRDALAGWTKRGNIQAAARAGQRIGDAFEQLGALQESMRAYLEALDLGKASHDRLLESEIRSDVGAAYARIGDYEHGLAQCRAALDLAEQARTEREKARAMTCFGEVEYHRGNSQAAVVFYRQAARVWESLGDRTGRAQILFLEGSAHSDLNELPEANADLNRALSMWREVGNKRGEALALLALTRLEYFPGQYQRALDRYTTFKDVFETAGDAVWEAACLSSIGYIYEQMGDRRSALANWEDASRIFERTGLQMAALEMMVKIGAAYLVSEPGTALRWFENARALSESSGNQHMHSWALRYIGVANLALGDPRRALEYLGQSMQRQQSIGDPRFRARTLADLGTAHYTLGDAGRARECFTHALEMARASSDRVGEATALFGLAQVSDAQGKLSSARQYVESALSVAESLRTEVENKDLRASYFATVQQYHELYVDVLMRLAAAQREPSFALAAFEASERARARSLLDSLAEAGVDLRTGIDSALLKRERALNNAFDEWAKRQRRASSENTDPSMVQALGREYRRLEDRYGQLEAEIRSRSPHYAALMRPRPLKLKEIQAQALDDDTVLLEYALGKQRSYLWAVSNHDYASYDLPPRAEIEQAARRAYALLTARLTIPTKEPDRRRAVEQADREYWNEATRLSEMLLAPVAKGLGSKRLLVVADGALQYLPFGALPVPGESQQPVPILTEHEIVSVPSASVLALLRRETRNRKLPEKSVAVLADPVFEPDDPRLRAASNGRTPSGMGLVFGRLAHVSPRSAQAAPPTARWSFSVPRLAGTREEADAIVAAAPARSAWRAIDFDASRATAMGAELARYRIVHFATHAVFDNEDPGRSGIVLSMFDARGEPQDGFLRLHDIYTLVLPSELVVLSACNTALGSPVQGEGLVGIVRGFIYAGAKRVVASHWKVDDESTGELMRRLYLEMFTQTRSPSAALRQAQLAMWKQPRWQAPFYWAAFVLQGEYK